MKQKQDNGLFKLVAYFSKKLNEAQKKKKAVFLECLAIKEALMYWRHHLLPIKFVVYSDHKPLENLKIYTKFDDELRELMIHLSLFNFEIKYVPGQSNAEADCLSRNPVLKPSEASSELKIVNFVKLNEIIDDQKEKFLEISKKINVINKNNVLFCKAKNSDKVTVSDEFLEELIKKVHFKFGHIGPGQMELTMSLYFQNSKLKALIVKFCQNCPVCTKNKSRIPFVFGPLSQ